MLIEQSAIVAAMSARSASETVAVIATGAAFFMIAVHGLVDSPYWKNDLSVEFWILAALAVVAQRAGRET